MINVTKTFLPPIEEFTGYVKKIWQTHWIANNGPLLRELEAALREYLGARHALIVSSGTMALQVLIEAMELRGKIITTPFSYVSTTSSIVWQRCVPVFADIMEDTLCVNPQSVEAHIDDECSAILVTHVFGNACETEELARIAKRHQLRLIYDAAHTFGVKYGGRHLACHGDAAVMSFHATKPFHMAEGGAVITDDDRWAQRVDFIRNLGHKGQEEFWGLGVNGKNSELHAALGLSVLKHIPQVMERLQSRYRYYDSMLPSSLIGRQRLRERLEYNHSYFPVIFSSETQLLAACKALNERDVFPRRYFYPSLNRLPYVPHANVPIADSIAMRVLCLPLSVYLEREQQEMIVDIVLRYCR